MRQNTTELLNRIAELAERRSCAELDRLMKEYERALIRRLAESREDADERSGNISVRPHNARRI